MKTYKRLYEKICSYDNLFLAWRKARKGKTLKFYVIEFQNNLIDNLEELQKELENETYQPKPLKIFILRDPKTRRISKANFRDRIIHHAVVNILEPIFEKVFIHDSCANRKGKGTFLALKRLELFKRKVTNNLKTTAFCLKADIKHYFQEVSHEILISILKEKIRDKRLIHLIRKILINGQYKEGIGMPLGNYTSQFLANVYLNKLDYFIKHSLRAEFYIRYVDDFIILHESREQLEKWKLEIGKFLKEMLKLEIHPQKSLVCSLSRGVDFVGFRCFWYYKLLRKRNVRKMFAKIEEYHKCEMSKERISEIFLGWNAYAKWANSFKLRRAIVSKI